MQASDQTLDGRAGSRPTVATVESTAGFRVTVLDIGAAIQAIRVPVGGGFADVVLGYDDPEAYLDDSYFMGTTVGRYANRIANAQFELNGEFHSLDANERATGNCLHGGSDGLHRQSFSLVTDLSQQKVVCRHTSPDGAGGFPGALDVSITYHLVGESALAIDYEAIADHDTVVSLANHAYFNLGGAIEDHELLVRADRYTPVDETLIPTGEIRDVAESEFDLRSLTRLGNRRFDHNFVLSGGDGDMRPAAELRSPSSGIRLKLHTTQQGLQVYTADSLSEPFSPRQGLCLEAQGFPDAPNQPGFPSTRLSVGEVYRQRTVYEFVVDNDSS